MHTKTHVCCIKPWLRHTLTAFLPFNSAPFVASGLKCDFKAGATRVQQANLTMVNHVDSGRIEILRIMAAYPIQVGIAICTSLHTVGHNACIA